jgi:hypothetical protein
MWYLDQPIVMVQYEERLREAEQARRADAEGVERRNALSALWAALRQATRRETTATMRQELARS